MSHPLKQKKSVNKSTKALGKAIKKMETVAVKAAAASKTSKAVPTKAKSKGKMAPCTESILPRPVVQSVVRRSDYPQSSTLSVQEVAGAIIKELQWRLPTKLLDNTNSCPQLVMGYLMWAFYSRMRDAGQLRDPSSPTVTFGFPEFPENCLIPTAWAKVIEHCMPYEDKASGTTYGSVFTFNSLPAFGTGTGISSTGSGLAFSAFYQVFGLGSGGAEYALTNAASAPVWSNVQTRASWVSAAFAEAFETTHLGCVPLWAPDASGHGQWGLDTGSGNTGAFCPVEKFDSEIVMLLHAPVAFPTGNYVNEIPSLVQSYSTQMYVDYQTNYRRYIVAGFVHMLSDCQYRVGRAHTLLQSHPHFVGVKRFTPLLQPLDLTLWNDMLAAYVRVGGDPWTSAVNMQAFLVYCNSVLVARIASVGIYQMDAMQKTTAYNNTSIAAPVPPMVANYLTALAPIVRQGRLLVPQLAGNTKITSYVAYLISPYDSSQVSPNQLYYNYLQGLVSSPAIGAYTFTTTNFSQQFYPMGVVALWSVFSELVRQVCRTGTWVPCDDDAKGGKAMECCVLIQDNPVVFSGIGGVSSVSQTHQATIGEITSNIPLTKFEMGQVCNTCPYNIDDSDRFRASPGAPFLNTNAQISQQLQEPNSELANALGIRLGERAKLSGRIAGKGVVNVVDVGETEMDAVREIVAGAVQDGVSGFWTEDPDERVGFDSSPYQWFVGEAKRSFNRLKKRHVETFSLSNPRLLDDVAKMLGVRPIDRYFSTLARELKDDAISTLRRWGFKYTD